MTTAAIKSASDEILHLIADNECRLLPDGRVSPDRLIAAVNNKTISQAEGVRLVQTLITPNKPVIAECLKGLGGFGWMEAKCELEERKVPGLAELRHIRLEWDVWHDKVAEVIYSGASVCPREPKETLEDACERLPEAARYLKLI